MDWVTISMIGFGVLGCLLLYVAKRIRRAVDDDVDIMPDEGFEVARTIIDEQFKEKADTIKAAAKSDEPEEDIASLVNQRRDTALCKGVLLPTSWVADYELMMAYSSKIEARYRVDTTALEKELYATQRLLEQAHKPVPFYEQKPFWTGVGIIIGGAAVVGGGYTILAVSKGD